MSTIAPTQPTASRVDPTWSPPPESLYRMSLEHYEAMVASGVFSRFDRFHLIRGLLVAKMTQNTPHSTSDLLCGAVLERIIPPGWHVRPGKPIRIPIQISKPEPDRSVVRGGIRDYRHRDPDASEVGMVVEVADSRLREARDLIPVYGGGGIPVYWIVNLVDRKVEVYSRPSKKGSYRTHKEYLPGQQVPVIIGGQQLQPIAVDEILP
jgi:Uma2 family endonuclease